MARPHAPARRRHAFTLIELLVVIAVIALLIAILLPALGHARSTSRLTLCTSNMRGQGHSVQLYANDFKEAMPPNSIYWNHLEETGFESSFWDLPRFLAWYADEPFPLDGVFHAPRAHWRCPEIRPDQDDAWQNHQGIHHSVSNEWLYNSANIDDETGDRSFSASALPGWETRFGSGWRRRDQIDTPSSIIAIADALSSLTIGDRHARESVGLSWQIVAGTPDANRGSHEKLQRWPAACLDGHAEALPRSTTYWENAQQSYAGSSQPLYDREVERLVWYVRRR